MTATTVVRARIDPKVKAEASDVLAAMGLTVSDAFRMLMVSVAQQKKLPFSPLVPNDETVAAIRESRSQNLPRFTTNSDLMDYLNDDD